MNDNFKICIIDDDVIYKFTITKTIEIIGFSNEIITFNDGEEGLNFILDNLSDKAALPDIIFLDINMPIMDGFQFLEEFKKIKNNIGKEITIYLVSSSVDSVDIERAKGIIEITDYIIKPIKRTQLASILEKFSKDFA